jgi:hypothetical protein
MVYLFILIATAILAINFLAHYFLFHTLVRFLDITNQTYLNTLRAAFSLLSFSFIIALILISYFSHRLVRLYYIVSATWLGLMLYFFLACLLVYLILFLGKILSFNINPKILTIGLLLAAVAVVIYGLMAAQNIRIKKLDIALPNLPAEWKNKTAVWISDLHLGAINNYEFASRVAKLIDNLRPDLLFIGGDFYDSQKNIDLDKLAQIFSALDVPRGKFFITGNHEEFGDNAKYVDALTKAGINFLNNKLVDLNGLQLIGLDYQTAYDRKNFATILENLKINKDKPSILLRHVPDKIDVASKFGVSLMLCGHTHNGQLFPVHIIDSLLYNGYGYGLKKSGQTAVYTSSGAGTWGPPMRILANPEIVQIKFK